MTFLVDGTLGGTFPSWTTATRPASPAVGQMGYNTTTGLFDQYTASGWVGGLTSAAQSIPFAALPTGSVLQVVRGSNTATYSVLGSAVATGITASITPKSTSSKILIFVNCRLYITTQGEIILYVSRNGSTTVQSNYTLYSSASNMAQLVTQVAYDSPATTSATTYTLYIASANQTGYINPNGGGDGTSSITLMEIA